MDRIQIIALFFNFIVYLLMIIPIFYFLFNKSIYKNKKKFISFLCISILIEVFLSFILYVFSHEIFSLFTKTTGIVNYAVYASKILFISSSLYGIKYLIPAYIWKNKNEHKKTAILVLSKIAVNILFIFIGYFLFNTKGILYSIPVVDLIYYIIYIKLFLNIIRYNI